MSRKRRTVGDILPRKCMGPCGEMFTPQKLLNSQYCNKDECQQQRHHDYIEKKKRDAIEKNLELFGVAYKNDKRCLLVGVRYYKNSEIPFQAYKKEEDDGKLVKSIAYKQYHQAQMNAIYHGRVYCSLRNFRYKEENQVINVQIKEKIEKDRWQYKPENDKLLIAAINDPQVMEGREKVPPYRGLIMLKSPMEQCIHA